LERILSTVIQGLNQQQQEAVVHSGGPLLVLAGAGSGKTRVITRRIAYLIKEKGIKPWEILAVTFTNKAAREMKERIESLLGDVQISWMGTFHSIASRILRTEFPEIGRDGTFSIIDANDQKAVIRDCLRQINLDEKVLSVAKALNKISSAKNQMQTPDEFSAKAFGYDAERIAKVYYLYQKTLEDNNSMDFDDLIMQMVMLLKNHEKIRNKYTEKFRHILIDEYQDVNPCQYQMAKLLCNKENNICAVGDDDQSIYGFRGADVSIILRFEKDYVGSRIIKLEENYRSTGYILDAAHAVVKNNKGRKDKRLWTSSQKGEKISSNACCDTREEARYIAGEIRKWRDKGKKFRDFAILYRANFQSRAIEEVLKQESIDYEIVGGTNFYERAEVKDAVSYLKFIFNNKDYISFRRIINVPTRGIGNVTQDKIIQEAILKNKNLISMMKDAAELPRVGTKIQHTLQELAGTLERLAEEKDKMRLSDFVNKVLEDVGYFEMLKTDPDPKNFERIENLEELISDAKDFEMTAENNTLEAFLEKIALYTDADSKKNTVENDNGKVTLMTSHSAKGLEFPVVFITGLEESVFPHFRSIQENSKSAIEEERRLFYVSITRAMEKLYLTYSRERTIHGRTHNQSPSRFLREIPDELTDRYLPELTTRKFTRKATDLLDKPRSEAVLKTEKFGIGDTVYHKIFGKGIVKKSEKGYVTADFTGVGSKTLSQDYLNPYGEQKSEINLKPGDKVFVNGKIEGIIKKTEGNEAYVILSGGSVEKMDKNLLQMQKN
jgi:DNA helicase II / ATP-dependent DNA helicase PcrA